MSIHGASLTNEQLVTASKEYIQALLALQEQLEIRGKNIDDSYWNDLYRAEIWYFSIRDVLFPNCKSPSS